MCGFNPRSGHQNKTNGYDTNPHPFTLQNKPLHACSCNCKCKQEGVFFFPPSFLSPPPSAPQPLRTRRHVFLHTLWAGSAYTNAARDLAQFSARFGTPLTCASIVLAHCMQRARRKISRLSAFRLSELHAYSRYHFWASCSGTSPYSPLSDSKSQIPLFNFFARPI